MLESLYEAMVKDSSHMSHAPLLKQGCGKLLRSPKSLFRLLGMPKTSMFYRNILKRNGKVTNASTSRMKSCIWN